MKVLIVRTGALFSHDEGALYAERLRKELVRAGHSTELTVIPFSFALAGIVPETTAYRLFDLRGSADVCIAVGPFAHAIRHENKRVWAVCSYSPLYEHWDTTFGALTASPTNHGLREYVLGIDRTGLLEARTVHAASRTLADTLSSVRGAPVEVLLPPALESLVPAAPESGTYLVATGSIADEARMDLLITAFGLCKYEGRLVLMGFQRTPEEREYVEQLVADSPRASDIEVLLDPDYTAIRERIAGCTATVNLRFRSPVLDVFSVAAGISGKPIVTASDCGELARVLRDGEDGYVADPAATSIAARLDAVLGTPRGAADTGRRFSEQLRRRLPSWESTAVELVK